MIREIGSHHVLGRRDGSAPCFEVVEVSAVGKASLQAETLVRVGGVARTRGVDRRLRAGMSRHHAQTIAVTLTMPTARNLVGPRGPRHWRPPTRCQLGCSAKTARLIL